MKEINSVTDNPNIFPDEDLIISGGNFHGQPLAISLDFLCIALSELASISERRIYQLIGGLRNLPLFLVKNPGLHSGFMIPQYTAAGIRWLLVRDEFGNYIYSWPEQDSRDAQNTRELDHTPDRPRLGNR
jgi:hypothetical protein